MNYYKQVKDNQITCVEAKSIDATSPNFVKATKAEYDSFIVSLPPPEPPEPEMDYKAEILKLKDEVKKLKDKD